MTFLWREGSQASNLFGKAFPVVAKYIAQSSLFTGNFPLLGPLTGEAGLKSTVTIKETPQGIVAV